MPEPIRDLPSALKQIADHWDEPRTERTLAELHRVRAVQAVRAVRVRVALCACAVLVLGGAGLRAYHARPHGLERPLVTDAAEPSSRALRLEDGSRVEPLSADAQVQVREQSALRSTLELTSGRARFEVVRREPRVFRVQCGEVTIEVLGTAFELTRSGGRTHVSVLHGRVAVRWGHARSELGAGEAGWFPKLAPAADSVSAEAASTAPSGVGSVGSVGSVGTLASSEKPATRRVSAKAAPRWREPAEQGDFERAYRLLAQAPEPVADDVEELLLAADAARLSGHPGAALPYLKRVIARHAQDSRAPLAAFTLGGVLMQQLGQPREAEAAYARARELSLNSSLAEDALARQVEAAHRAGDAARARALATEYLKSYPNGRRVHAVQRFGGLVKPAGE